MCGCKALRKRATVFISLLITAFEPTMLFTTWSTPSSSTRVQAEGAHMPLQPPSLDNLTFEQIRQRARLRIPRYTPEWTDFNESDPGATLIELFAWLTEMMGYQMNKIPERNYLKFLQLMGLELRQAQPAVVHLTFKPEPGALTAPVLPRTRVSAQPAGGGLPVIFETL